MRKFFAALSIAAAFVSFSAPGHAQETGMVVMQGVCFGHGANGRLPGPCGGGFASSQPDGHDGGPP